jgi:hypothetical protein
MCRMYGVCVPAEVPRGHWLAPSDVIEPKRSLGVPTHEPRAIARKMRNVCDMNHAAIQRQVHHTQL